MSLPSDPVESQIAGRAAAAARQDSLTKPPGSLGQLESTVLDLAAIQGMERPVSRPAAALVFAADHPVVRHGVAAFPASVTAGMVTNFARGGAAASVSAAFHGIPLEVHDVGVETAYPAPAPGGTVHVVRHAMASEAAGDLRTEDALSPGLFDAALDAGRRAVMGLNPRPKVLILGEMGIGNTTPASAVAAALLGVPGESMVGPGTGLDPDGVRLKGRVVADALERADFGAEADPLEVLRRVGGRELAALAGAALAAREIGAAVLVDGFIVTAAVFAAVRSEPRLRGHLIFAHRSGEPGHARMLDALGADPLLDLGLRLGEGSGALSALGLLDLACELHRGMATFADAGLEGGRPGGEGPTEGDPAEGDPAEGDSAP